MTSLQSILLRFADALAIVLCLSAIVWAADLLREFRWLPYTEQYLALVLALTLALVFLHVRRDGSRGGKVPAYDLAASLTGLASGLYVTWNYPALSEELAYDPSSGIVIAGLVLVLLLEALRRTAGRSLTLIVSAFLAYGLVGHLVPGRLAGRDVAVDRLLTSLVLDTNGLLGTPLLITATIVIVFILFGQLLNACGGSAFFTDLALAAMGRYRGGGAKIAILASSLFGSISGSAVSNVATTGIVTIPLMRKSGLKPETAAGIEAVASTGGQLMPPVMGAAAFLMAEFLEVPYSDVVLAALVPALLYYGALFVQVDLRAARDEIAAIDVADIPRVGNVLRSGWFFILPFAVLIAGLFWLNFGADKAGLAAAATIALVGMILVGGTDRVSIRGLLRSVRDTGCSVIDLVVITSAAGVIIGVLNLSGLSFGLTLLLVDLGNSSLPLLLAVAAGLSIVLGMGMPTIGVYVLLAALVAPSIVELGVPPIAAHMFVLYFGMMSMITPPVAIASYAAATLARTNPIATSWQAMLFGWTAYVVPFLFVVEPGLLLQGGLDRIVPAIALAGAGVWLVTIGIVGYFKGSLGTAARLGCTAAGAGLMFALPMWSAV